MPIYEYRCAACGHEIEALQKLSEAPLTECPACHKPELKKLLSAAGFQLKGSGWYATDFRNSGAKPAAKEKSAAKPTASSDNGGTTAAGGGESPTATETKSADKPATGTTTESKPAATTTSTPKSDS
jgi:putative FmdB family regulatory protein